MKPQNLILGIVILVIIIGAVAVFYFSNLQSTPTPTATPTPTQTESQTPTPTATPTPTPTGEIQEFWITAKKWEFNQTRIEVIEGNTIILNIIGLDDGTGNGHGFEIAEYNINRVIRVDETIIIEFVANKRGTFTFRCSVACGVGHFSMTGTLVVG